MKYRNVLPHGNCVELMAKLLEMHRVSNCMKRRNVVLHLPNTALLFEVYIVFRSVAQSALTLSSAASNLPIASRGHFLVLAA